MLLGAAAFVAGGALMSLAITLLPQRVLDAFDLSRLFQGTPGRRAWLFVAAALVAPLCEEAAFRGWLLSALRARLRDGAAIAWGGLLFAGMHLDPVRFVPLWALGALFGWLTVRAGSIWPAVLAHAVNNGLGLALATSAARAGVPRPTRAAALEAAPASLAALAIAGLALWGLCSAYRTASRAPPPLDALLVPRSPAPSPPAHPSTPDHPSPPAYPSPAVPPPGTFRWEAVPRGLLAAALAGALALGLLLLLTRAGTPGT